MKRNKHTVRALVALVLFAALGGCQLVKKLTGRGGDDAGSTRGTSSPILGDAGGVQPVIALPNPHITPLPTIAVPTLPMPVGAADAGAAMAATTDVGAGGTGGDGDAGGPSIAVVDAGLVEPNDPRARRNYYRNFCKEHPGRVHPITHVLCPI
jgi:hypothetical protein